ncbi:30S ribosomal protein S17 [Candidatus Gottesmanbacteria bacterium]|nr:30S ribosomal protein S17 [Candidatus Gottesmanbacteria bacterium]
MQKLEGVITSVKMKNTVSVVVPYIYQHPKYKKILKKTTKLLVHNELENLKEGDTVTIMKCKPYSKRKHFIVLNKV